MIRFALVRFDNTGTVKNAAQKLSFIEASDKLFQSFPGFTAT